MMKISKKDDLIWFEFFASVPEDEPLMVTQQEIVYVTCAQLDRPVQARRAK